LTSFLSGDQVAIFGNLIQVQLTGVVIKLQTAMPAVILTAGYETDLRSPANWAMHHVPHQLSKTCRRFFDQRYFSPLEPILNIGQSIKI
jgi:hypothetical protein